MGMDLEPVRPTKNAPLRADGGIKWGSYNLSGWSELWKFASEHGVDTSEFSGCNDGARIKAATCRKIADTIETNFENYLVRLGVSAKDTLEIEACKLDILLWRNCGGYRQY